MFCWKLVIVVKRIGRYEKWNNNWKLFGHWTSMVVRTMYFYSDVGELAGVSFSGTHCGWFPLGVLSYRLREVNASHWWVRVWVRVYRNGNGNEWRKIHKNRMKRLGRGITDSGKRVKTRIFFGWGRGNWTTCQNTNWLFSQIELIGYMILLRGMAYHH